MISEVYNIDCMVGMAKYPDKYFDLAIVDPPYGAGDSIMKNRPTPSTQVNGKNKYKIKKWNFKPKKEYFDELFRVSKNQIIWGGNYFTSYLSESRAWIYWDKENYAPNFSDGELAWTSFDKVLKRINFSKYSSIDRKNRIHPTEKPIGLYKFCLSNYANPGDKILDTHLGSGSSRIAAYDYGFDFVGFELDKDYFEAHEKRFKNHIAQQKLF